MVAWLLALFLGFVGADRFYRGFTALGIAKLLTLGGCGIWTLIDLLLIIFTGGRDAKGLPLANYDKHKKVSWIVTAIALAFYMIMVAVSTIAGGSDQSAPPAEGTVTAPASEPATETSAAPVAEQPTEAVTSSASPATTEAPAPAPAPDVPAEQAAMTEAVATARTEAENADTDLQRANVLTVRSDAMCGAVPDGRIENWIGTVRTVDANGEGKAIVTVEIAEDIEIGTWNNAVSDVSDNTLIEQGTPLFDQALALKPGDTVRFSGTLKSGSDPNDRCYYTSNMTEVMSIDSPDYIVNFSSLEKI